MLLVRLATQTRADDECIIGKLAGEHTLDRKMESHNGIKGFEYQC